jgi:hypothetical protein
MLVQNAQTGPGRDNRGPEIKLYSAVKNARACRAGYNYLKAARRREKCRGKRVLEY